MKKVAYPNIGLLIHCGKKRAFIDSIMMDAIIGSRKLMAIIARQRCLIWRCISRHYGKKIYPALPQRFKLFKPCCKDAKLCVLMLIGSDFVQSSFNRGDETVHGDLVAHPIDLVHHNSQGFAKTVDANEN